ncbi:MAG: hypothetical protein COB90_03865 [Hyphomicrobiales bacterium]|nr:MAG: hypothetical protein COB90_03865 [Hyphomicrobiales bacterium]
MVVLYDYKLVILSLTVAILAAHAGMLVLSKSRTLRPLPFKMRVSAGALVIGGGVWTMHFIGMLALHLAQAPEMNAFLAINYAVLPTLVSGLIVIVLTGLGLYVAMSGHLQRYNRLVGAVLMGSGISSMHYVGMEAIKSVCIVTYTPQGIITAVGLGIGVSWLALRIAATRYRGKRRNFASAIVLGLAISSMHYVAMYNTHFAFFDDPVILPRPAFDTTYLACIVAVLTFFLVNAFLLLALPSARRGAAALSYEPVDGVTEVVTTDVLEAVPTRSLDENVAEDQPVSIGIDINAAMHYINASSILFVSAYGHYTQIGYVNETGMFSQQMCNRQLSDLAGVLEKLGIVRVHRSHLANIKHVSGLRKKGERGEVIFRHDQAPRIPVSRSRLANFSNAVADVCGAI